MRYLLWLSAISLLLPLSQARCPVPHPAQPQRHTEPTQPSFFAVSLSWILFQSFLTVAVQLQTRSNRAHASAQPYLPRAVGLLGGGSWRTTLLYLAHRVPIRPLSLHKSDGNATWFHSHAHKERSFMVNLSDSLQIYERLYDFIKEFLLGKLAFYWAKLSIPLGSWNACVFRAVSLTSLG